MQAHTSRSHRCMLRHAGFSPFLVPVGAVEHNVLQIFDVLATSHTSIANLERRVRTLLVPHSTKGS
eukprot:910287-Amphidinium_carterae.2